MSVPVRRRTAAVIGGVAAALLLAACGSSSDSSSASGSPAASNTDPACADYASYGSHPGTSVSVFTSILPPEQQKFEAAWAQFSKCTGITIKYEGSDQFEAQLPTRVAGGNAPDIAFIPQPGLLSKMVQTGAVKAAPADTGANVDKYWNPQWKTYGSVDGTFYSAPLGSNMKSFVWYSPSFFKAKGYTVPTTWDDLWTLSDKIAADGIKPWCGGIESGGATGWLATDWLEETVLRQSGGDVYDKWISHEVKFDSPEITKAMDPVAGVDEERQVRERRHRQHRDDRHHGVPGRRQADPDQQVRHVPAGVVLRRAVADLQEGRQDRRGRRRLRVLPAVDRPGEEGSRGWRRVRHRVLGQA